jgi:hypothetical protein
LIVAVPRCFVYQQQVRMNRFGQRDGGTVAELQFVGDILHTFSLDRHDSQPPRSA